MCLSNFKEFKRIKKSEPIIGYRNWKLKIHNPIELSSQFRDYKWTKAIEGPHVVKAVNSGIYAYNNYNNYNNYYYNNYNNYNNYYNNYNNYYYYKYNKYNNNYYEIKGIINQYGKTAIHEIGQRSQYAKIVTLFTIRELDAKGIEKFIDWIKIFNGIIKTLALKYKANTIHWQDFSGEIVNE